MQSLIIILGKQFVILKLSDDAKGAYSANRSS